MLLISNKFGDNAALCLAQLLQSSYILMKQNPRNTTFQLTEISVSNNNIQEKGMIALLLSIEYCKEFSLKTLKMAHCHPTIAVLDQVANILSSPNSLSVLELDFSLMASIDAIRDPDYSHSLKKLSLSLNDSLQVFTLGELYNMTLKASFDPSVSVNDQGKLKACLECLNSIKSSVPHPVFSPIVSTDSPFKVSNDFASSQIQHDEEHQIFTPKPSADLKKFNFEGEQSYSNSNSNSNLEFQKHEFEKLRLQQSVTQNFNFI